MCLYKMGGLLALPAIPALVANPAVSHHINQFVGETLAVPGNVNDLIKEGREVVAAAGGKLTALVNDLNVHVGDIADNSVEFLKTANGELRLLGETSRHVFKVAGNELQQTGENVRNMLRSGDTLVRNADRELMFISRDIRGAIRETKHLIKGVRDELLVITKSANGVVRETHQLVRDARGELKLVARDVRITAIQAQQLLYNANQQLTAVSAEVLNNLVATRLVATHVATILEGLLPVPAMVKLLLFRVDHMLIGAGQQLYTVRPMVHVLVSLAVSAVVSVVTFKVTFSSQFNSIFSCEFQLLLT